MDIDIIGVPIDFGAGRRGVDMGPSAIRYAGLEGDLRALGHTVIDRGNIQVPLPEMCQVLDPRLRYLDCIIPVARRLMGMISNSIRAGRFPITLGGDHSLSIGSVRGAARNRNIGLIWIDAHGDYNTHETSPSGNLHGMSLAALNGIGDPRVVGLNDPPTAAVDPNRTVIIGARDFDPGEKMLLKQSGAHVFPISSIDRFGIATVIEGAIEIAGKDTDGIYLSFDLDVVNPQDAPGVGTPIPGGISYREAHLACEMLAGSNKLIGLEFVEVNPILDERNITAILAKELVLSAVGKCVW